MNSSPRSSSRRGLLLFGATLVLFGVGCADDLASPTQGTVKIQLDAATAGAAEGARIYDGDFLLATVARESELELHLSAGDHALRVEKPCTAFSPAASVQIAVTAGREHVVAWRAEAEGGVTVTSTFDGAAILLDGAATGKVTPATLECVSPGQHVIGVEFLGATAEAPKTIQVGDGTASVDFALTPTAQARGALLEVCTATFCPNCPSADAACNQLTLDTSLPVERFIGVEVHSRWGGTDIFATGSSIARDDFLGGERQGNPLAIVNGDASFRGAGPTGDIPTLVAAYRTMVNDALAQDGKIGLHWISPQYTPGEAISGQVRVFAITDPTAWGATDLSSIEVWAAYYKNGLTFNHPTHGLTTYYHVIREYKKLGSAAELGLDALGDHVDLAYAFDLRDDSRYGEDEMGVLIFVQNAGNREVLQVIHRTVTGAP